MASSASLVGYLMLLSASDVLAIACLIVLLVWALLMVFWFVTNLDVI